MMADGKPAGGLNASGSGGGANKATDPRDGAVHTMAPVLCDFLNGLHNGGFLAPGPAGDGKEAASLRPVAERLVACCNDLIVTFGIPGYAASSAAAGSVAQPSPPDGVLKKLNTLKNSVIFKGFIT